MNNLSIIYIILILISFLVMSLSFIFYYTKEKSLLLIFTFSFSGLTLLWLFCDLMVQLSSIERTIFFYHELKYISIIGLPLIFYLFSYTNHHNHGPSKRHFIPIMTLGLSFFVIILTNASHSLFRKNLTFIHDYTHIVNPHNGIFYYLLIIYVYILLLFSCYYLFLDFSTKIRFYRHREGLLLLGSSFPIIGNITYQITHWYFKYDFDITPLTFFATLITYTIVIFLLTPQKIRQEARNLIFEHMTTGSIFIDQHNQIFDINHHILSLTNLTFKDVIHHDVSDFDHPLFTLISQILTSPDDQSLIYKHEHFPLHQYFLLKGNTVYDKYNSYVGTVFLLTDVSELQHTLNQLDYVGNHDDLTGVYNRYYFQRMLKEMDTTTNYPVAIIVGDINGLKTVNDSYGHSAGDSLLVEAAEKLVQIFKSTAKVCRIGGDEFVIISPNTNRDEIVSSITQLESHQFSYSNKYSNIGISLDFSIKFNDTIDLSELFKRADANMYRKKVLLGSSSRDNNLQLLKKILSGKSIETIQHLERTSYLCQQFAKRLHLDHNQTNSLILLSQLHDIGKTVIPDQILFKPASLDSDEWTIMKTHSQEGYNILLSSQTLHPISQLVLHHHERYDGNGYPSQLKGKDIPYLSRIISIIDSYDAIISKRIYKESRTKDEAIAELRRCSGSQFDPYLCQAFIEMIESDTEKLSNPTT